MHNEHLPAAESHDSNSGSRELPYGIRSYEQLLQELTDLAEQALDPANPLTPAQEEKRAALWPFYLAFLDANTEYQHTIDTLPNALTSEFDKIYTEIVTEAEQAGYRIPSDPEAQREILAAQKTAMQPVDTTNQTDDTSVEDLSPAAIIDVLHAFHTRLDPEASPVSLLGAGIDIGPGVVLAYDPESQIVHIGPYSFVLSLTTRFLGSTIQLTTQDIVIAQERTSIYTNRGGGYQETAVLLAGLTEALDTGAHEAVVNIQGFNVYVELTKATGGSDGAI